MIQYRRIVGIVLGMWMGAAVFADFAVTRNFQTIDRFLQAPGANSTAVELVKIGQERLRPILRRNAGEENNIIFDQWEIAELLIAGVLIALLFIAGRPNVMAVSLAFIMLAIVAGQHFYLSPQIAALGREIADLPATDPLNSRFWMAHGVYSGLEILKLLLGLALAARLAWRRKDSDHAARQPETELVARLNG